MFKCVFAECTGGKVQQMLTGIQSSDEGQQLQSVIEMCQVIWWRGDRFSYFPPPLPLTPDSHPFLGDPPHSGFSVVFDQVAKDMLQAAT